MITGSVSADREARVGLVVIGSDNREPLDFVIDTGFNGYLTLPGPLIGLLGLVYHSQAVAMLADGSTIPLRKYEARVEWEGGERDVLVLEADGGPLLGMSLLYGSRVTLDVVDGGAVTITSLP